jgi:ATP-dependent DNA ligase
VWNLGACRRHGNVRENRQRPMMVGVLGSEKKLKKASTFVTPMAAQPIEKLPEGGDWIYELKLDGSPYS